MAMFRLLVTVALFALSACATVNTQIVELTPGQKYPPKSPAEVEVFLQKPNRTYADIALIESRGESEAEMLNDARAKAAQLGADAIIRNQTLAEFHPPVAVYDPWYDPFWGYPYRRIAPFYPYPWGGYRVVGGYSTYVLKAVAIRYTSGK